MSPAQLEDGLVPRVAGVLAILPLTTLLGGKSPTLHLLARCLWVSLLVGVVAKPRAVTMKATLATEAGKSSGLFHLSDHSNPPNHCSLLIDCNIPSHSSVRSVQQRKYRIPAHGPHKESHVVYIAPK